MKTKLSKKVFLLVSVSFVINVGGGNPYTEAPRENTHSALFEFVHSENTVRFKINKKAVDEAGIWMSSQIFRLAIQLIE